MYNTDGTHYKRLLRLTWKYHSTASSGTINLDGVVPANAVITRVWYDCVTALESDNSTATTGVLRTKTDNVTLVTSSALTSGWTAGVHNGVPRGDDPSTYVKLSSDRRLQLIVSGSPSVLTAGKVIFYIEYVVSD